MVWQVAKTSKILDDVLVRASAEGPQIVVRGSTRYVVLEEVEYKHPDRTKLGFLDFLRTAPDFSGVEIERDPAPVRDIEL